MKNKLSLLLFLLLCISSAIGQTPTITMTTSKPVGSTISFQLFLLKDSVPIQIDFGDGNLVDTIIISGGGLIAGKLIGSQTIKLYGTLESNFFYCDNNQLTALDISKDTALIQLNCNFNQLKNLDISNNKALTSLKCSDNQFDSLDVSNNTELDMLVCWNNQLKKLDIGKITKLTGIYCMSNQITNLDLTNDENLKILMCHYNYLTTLNLSNNKTLEELWCADNKINALDVSDMAALSKLWCQNNNLSLLDVSGDTSLTEIHCDGNRLSFCTLPIPENSYTTYIYSPQKPIAIARELTGGAEVDLSSQLKVNDKTTYYNWRTKSGATLLKETDFNITDGKTVFLKSQADSVYCEMTNITFPNLSGSNILKTTCTKLPEITATEDIITPIIEIYTNNNLIYINLSSNGELSVFDVNGRMIISRFVNIGTNLIPLKNSGVYFVKIKSNQRTTVQKVYIE
jgi:hypothetical protein